ncbi:MAG: hypothetical protein U1F10_09415 [Burkholderiales bacterium]
MRTPHEIDPEGAREAGVVRAVVASLCVMGLASLMWVHSGVPLQADEPSARAESADFLRAPTTDPSLPGLDATVNRQDAAADPAPAPTF